MCCHSLGQQGERRCIQTIARLIQQPNSSRCGVHACQCGAAALPGGKHAHRNFCKPGEIKGGKGIGHALAMAARLRKPRDRMEQPSLVFRFD